MSLPASGARSSSGSASRRSRSGAAERVEEIEIVHNELVDGGARAVPTDRHETIGCGLVFRSVGYLGVALPGVPFDEAKCVIPNDRGRVEPGLYAAGWIKRGPTGVIGTNKKDATETVEQLLEDARAGLLHRDSDERLESLLEERGAEAVMYGGWEAIDLRGADARRAARPPADQAVLLGGAARGREGLTRGIPRSRVVARSRKPMLSAWRSVSARSSASAADTGARSAPTSTVRRSTSARSAATSAGHRARSSPRRPGVSSANARWTCAAACAWFRAGARLGAVASTEERIQLWGGETAKAVANFPVSGEPIPAPVARWLGRIKAAAARVNAELDLLDADKAERIAAAGDRIAAGELDDQFPIDVFQTGSGTSSNMNANEVMASLAGDDVHANDDVNMGQSSNDVFPSAVHLAALDELTNDLLPALRQLGDSLAAKAEEFDDVVKSGRTHWMDAVPVTLGQEFGGYAAQVRQGIARVESTLERVGQIPLGGTAVGTGLNTHPEFAARVREKLSAETGLRILPPADPFEAQAARDALVEASGALKTVAVSLTKIANDLRFMGSGPRAGLAEIFLPELQKGQLDHARQGQPGHPRGRHPGRRAGDRERRCDRDRRHAGPLRAQRLRPADRP